MNEEKIFGNFTLYQVIIISGTFGLSYMVFGKIPSPYSLVIIGSIFIIAGMQWRKNPPPVFNEEYLQKKRHAFTTQDEYQKWLQKKFAMYTSMKMMRKEKGFTEDPKITEALNLIERYKNKI